MSIGEAEKVWMRSVDCITFNMLFVYHIILQNVTTGEKLTKYTQVSFYYV